MIVAVERLSERLKPRPMEWSNTYQLRWSLTKLNPLGQGIRTGVFAGRSVSVTAPAVIQGHNGEQCDGEEMWFDILTFERPGLQQILVPTAWIRPYAKNGAIVTAFFNLK